MNRFKPFPVKSNDSNSNRSRKSQFWPIWGTFWPIWTQFPHAWMVAVWPMGLNHNRNSFRSFAVKSNNPNSINSPISHFWDIFGHIGHLLTLLGNFHMREWWPTVLNHNRKRFRPFSAKSNHSNSIRSRKNQFWAILGKSGQAHGQISHYQHRHCIPFMVLYHHTKNH